MESRFIEQSKADYAKLLTANGSIERAKEIAELETYSPIFKYRETHEEEEPVVKDLNEMFNESYKDINTLIIGFRDSAKNFEQLMLTTDARLKQIKKQLLIEKEKLEDINILCNQYSDFNSVITFDESTLFGSYSYDNGIIGAKIKSYEPIQYTIESIDGNGYEGNSYVYNNDKFISSVIDTSNRQFINDNNTLTAYEYSRITASNSEKEVFPYINFDSIEAKQTIKLKSTSEFNKIKISVSSVDTFLSSVAISPDGISYKNILKSPIEINNESIKYDKVNYIASSGLLCFPSTKYLKLILESNGVTDDIIAFENIVVLENKTDQPLAESQQDKNYTASDERYIYNMTKSNLLLHVFQQEEE